MNPKKAHTTKRQKTGKTDLVCWKTTLEILSDFDNNQRFLYIEKKF